MAIILIVINSIPWRDAVLLGCFLLAVLICTKVFFFYCLFGIIIFKPRLGSFIKFRSHPYSNIANVIFCDYVIFVFKMAADDPLGITFKLFPVLIWYSRFVVSCIF